jgi:hypothetical protein
MYLTDDLNKIEIIRVIINKNVDKEIIRPSLKDGGS